ncbi:PepSY domain-containing protein [Pelomonas sp. P7]|uniref:PepSY domain-containing protein n=1 Tax=Pelomonas caseinilytica TaxID=2906763 RepID=A0ABS8XE59_9BURK|nr:PepSY domain-containing protein [Pelomonas sp. P7]MCE4537727.1 PepSY domain-containing protein [Pelomonas sp. P7]
MRRALYLLHRWAGIALGLVMALWFLSGMVMLYVGYPKLTPAEQMQGLPVLRAGPGCCVPLADALAASGLRQPAQWRLLQVAGQPRYVFGDGRRLAVAVDAVSGRRVTAVDRDAAVVEASAFAGGLPARWLGLADEDAWTHSRALDPHRPLHRVAVDDAAGRWLYVSSRTGEVVRDATAAERRWGWLGAWLHWLYPLRGGALDAWWADIVIGLAVAGSALALSGLVAGLWRWRFQGRYKSGSRSPYRGGLMRWHHLVGLAGGTLALTWVVSGLFSMNPWKVFEAAGPRADRQAFAGGPLRADDAPEARRVLQRLAADGWQPRLLEWRRVAGRPVVLVQAVGDSFLADAEGRRLPPLDESTLAAAAARMLPGARIAERQWLHGYDAHYYAREPHTMGGQRERPLPALRLRFDDAAAHEAVIDPATGTLVQLSTRPQRAQRWLFAFLHSFDLPRFLDARPAWDAWMLGFSLAGLALSATGVVMGWRRLRGRPRRRAVLPFQSPQETS